MASYLQGRLAAKFRAAKAQIHNVRFGSLADIRRWCSERPLMGAKQT